jgi:hypothetical protein
VLTVDLEVVEHANPPENQATESNWKRSLVTAGYSKTRNELAMVREKPMSEGSEISRGT